LGCTHFPVFRDALQRLLGDGVRVIDSAQTAASTVAAALTEHGLASAHGGKTVFLATDGVARFQRVGAVFMGGSLDSLANVELVDI
jgi:glutamate racemase